MAFAFSHTITIDHTKCGSSDSTNFPALFSGTYAGPEGASTPDLRTVANGGPIQHLVSYNSQMVPADLVIASNSGLSSALSFDIASYNPVTGQIEIWVKIPTLSHTADTVIFIAYGDSGVTTYQGGAVGDAWNANYIFVCHFADGSTLSVKDSTANGNDLVNGSAAAGAGTIDGCASFNGSTQYLESGNILGASHISVQAWINPNALPGIMQIICADSNSVGLGTRQYQFRVNGSNVVEWIPFSGGSPVIVDGATTIPTNTWTLVHATADGLNAIIYFNGTQDGTGACGNVDLGFGTSMVVGARDAGSVTNPFSGLIDEARYLHAALSPDWILSEYHNQSSPSTFYAITANGGGGGLLPRLMTLGAG